jgi:hypothetical protein
VRQLEDDDVFRDFENWNTDGQHAESARESSEQNDDADLLVVIGYR